MSQPVLPDPYPTTAPWPAARGGLGNPARRTPRPAGSPSVRRWALGQAVVAAPLVGAGDVVHVATIDGRKWTLRPGGDEPRSVALGAAVAAAGCLDGHGRSIWPLVDGSLVALDADDREIWRYALRTERPTPTLLPTRALRAPLSLAADGSVLAGSDDTHLYAVRPDGSLAWAAPLGLPVRSQPATTADGAVIVGGLDATVTRLDGATGRVEWRRNVGHGVLGGLITDGGGTVVAVTMGGRVVGLDAAKGRITWTSTLDGPLVAPPAGLPEGWAVATLAGQLVRLSPTGRTLASVDLGQPLLQGPVVIGDAIVVATEGGEVRAFAASDLTPLGDPHGLQPQPRAVRGVGIDEHGVVVATTAGDVVALPLGALTAPQPDPPGSPQVETPAPGAPVSLCRLHLDEPSLLGAFDPLLGVGVQIDVAFHDVGAETLGLGRLRDVTGPSRSTWVVFDVEETAEGRRLSTSGLPLTLDALSLSLPASFDLARGRFEITFATGLQVPGPASGLAWASHFSVLVERAGKPFVAMRRVLEDLSSADLPTARQLASQLRGLGAAGPRWVAALSGLAQPSRWRGFQLDSHGEGRVAVAPWTPPEVAGVVDHVRFDAARRRIVAEVADPRGEGLHPDDLLILLVRDGRRVDVDVVGPLTVTVRRDIVTAVILELPLDLVVDAALEARVFVGHREVWRGPVLGGSAAGDDA